MLRAAASFCLACLAVLPLSSCLDRVRFAEQELQFRYDAEKDELDLLLLYRGLQPPTDDAEGLERAQHTIEGMLAGSRFVIVGDWFAAWDLDLIVAALTELEAEPLDDPTALALAVARDVEIRAVGLVRDPEHRLGLYQFVRVPKASRLVRAVNLEINRHILAEAAKPPKASDLQGFEAGTQARILEKARSGADWITFSGSRLELRAPAGPRDVADFVAAYALKPDSVLSGILGALSELESCDGELRLTFLPDEGGRWRVHFGPPSGSPHPEGTAALADALAKAGRIIEDEPSWADVRELLVKKQKGSGR